jgi:hypothetical protein
MLWQITTTRWPSGKAAAAGTENAATGAPCAVPLRRFNQRTIRAGGLLLVCIGEPWWECRWEVQPLARLDLIFYLLDQNRGTSLWSSAG